MRFNWSVRLNWRFSAADLSRPREKWRAMRLDAKLCDATHTLAMIKRRRRAKNLRAKDFKGKFGRRSQIIPGGARRARGKTLNVQISHGAILVLRPFIWFRNLFVNTRVCPCTPHTREIFVGFIDAVCSIRLTFESCHFAWSFHSSAKSMVFYYGDN